MGSGCGDSEVGPRTAVSNAAAIRRLASRSPSGVSSCYRSIISSYSLPDLYLEPSPQDLIHLTTWQMAVYEPPFRQDRFWLRVYVQSWGGVISEVPRDFRGPNRRRSTARRACDQPVREMESIHEIGLSFLDRESVGRPKQRTLANRRLCPFLTSVFSVVTSSIRLRSRVRHGGPWRTRGRRRT